MFVGTGARVVRSPWEQAPAGRLVSVGREAHVSPEPGAWARYQAVFPDRVCRWNVLRQCFEILQPSAHTGQLMRVSLLDETVTGPDGHQYRVFIPLDHRWVDARIRDYHDALRFTPLELAARRTARNKAIQARVKHRSADMLAYSRKQFRRYVGMFTALARGESLPDARTERTPQVSVGVRFAPSSLATKE